MTVCHKYFPFFNLCFKRYWPYPLIENYTFISSWLLLKSGKKPNKDNKMERWIIGLCISRIPWYNAYLKLPLNYRCETLAGKSANNTKKC